MESAIDYVSSLNPDKPIMHLRHSIDSLLLLIDAGEDVSDEIDRQIAFEGFDETFAFYITSYDDINWKLAAAMMRHCNYDDVMREIDVFGFGLNRARNRLAYLRDSDV